MMSHQVGAQLPGCSSQLFRGTILLPPEQPHHHGACSLRYEKGMCAIGCGWLDTLGLKESAVAPQRAKRMGCIRIPAACAGTASSLRAAAVVRGAACFALDVAFTGQVMVSGGGQEAVSAVMSGS